MTRGRISSKAASFTESVIREMTRLATAHGAINLAQGFPNFPAPEWLKEEACRAIRQDFNQYAVTWGAPSLRKAIAQKYEQTYAFPVDPDREITVACGATECMIAALLAILDPGDRVIVLEPFYENYGPDAIISSADPVFVPLDAQSHWALDIDRLEQTIRTQGPVRALILNDPHNPAGKAFSTAELKEVARLAQQYDFYILTDEIYEHILYDGRRHQLIASFPGMRGRTITISGISKTFSVTGWRIGYLIASPDVTGAIRKMHDFLTVGAAAPLQEAAAAALLAPRSYYEELAKAYQERRDFFIPALSRIGFEVNPPDGAYYVLADISGLTRADDVSFVRQLVTDFGVAAVPGSSFYSDPVRGRSLIRFAFCKTASLLEEAVGRLEALQR